METDHTDVITGSSGLPRLAIICGVAAAIAGTIAATGVADGELHDLIARAATVLTIVACVAALIAAQDRRTAARMTALYSLHCDERAEADERHLAALRAVERRRQEEVRAAEERHERELHDRQAACEQERERHLELLRLAVSGRAAAEAREREQGRREGERVADVQLAAQQERHEAELERAIKEAEERGEARGYARGLDTAARIDAEESAPRSNGIVRRIPPPR